MTPAFEYVTYGRMDELHQLQSPRTGARAELNFILLSQAEELLFRAVGDDLHTAREALGGDRVEDACAALARAARTQRALLACWEPMNGMTADEFVAFREVLKNASGEQSVTYRSLEFLLGNRPERHVGTVRREGTPLLAEELGRPSLYDTALVWLAGRGCLDPSATPRAPWARQHEPRAEIEDAWLEIYRDPGTHPQEFRLAEGLLEVAYQFSLWRAAHLLVVERMLGGKGGTGGTDGASWLRVINEHRFFPELWTFRTRL